MPEHLARHPFGLVPALTFPDGTSLYESCAIAKYIAAAYAPSLLPSPTDLLATARFDEAMSAVVCYFSQSFRSISAELWIKGFLGGDVDEAALAKGREALSKHFEVLDAVLDRQQFIAADELGLADVTYIPLIQRLIHVGEGQLALDKANVRKWWERCMQNEAVKKYCLEAMPTLEKMQELVQQARSA